MINKGKLLSHRGLTGYENVTGLEKQQLALQNYQTADSLVTYLRQIKSLKPDKIALGKSAEELYKGAVRVCETLAAAGPGSQNTDKLHEQAFYFSERNKSAVLSTSLAHADALQFAGLPDSLIQLENDLQREKALYIQKLAEQPDSATVAFFRDKLFAANRSYESLMETLKRDHLRYHEMVHDEKNVSIDELQNVLDKKSAIVSYLTSDSVVYVQVVTKNNFKMYPLAKNPKFNTWIRMFRKSILSQQNKVYINYAQKLCRQLIPENAFPKNIENLVIIPDGALATIPFGALLTGDDIKPDNNSLKEYPFLIKNYNISYAYSATLWYQQKNSPTTNFVQNGLLAVAPVFDDTLTAGLCMRTRSLLASVDSTGFATDSLPTRGKLLNGQCVTSLPDSEKEVTQIFELFEREKLPAITKTHQLASESFIKSDTVSSYKYIHIATHGFVNEQKPELSAILLAQDTSKVSLNSNQEDNILYSGEIYNLKLNADLVVLSACETGLGKIKEGEGVIGLSRALMYAGANNLVVSLWKVPDESTAELMVDFYRNVLRQKQSKKAAYSASLRKAKLQMIESGKYSHPFYWSPFVVLGR